MDRCALCHAQDGSGDTATGRRLNVPDLRSDEIQDKTDAELLEAISEVQIHPEFERQIGEEGLRDVLAYLRTLKVVSDSDAN